jgi:amino acid adenylation domain-containing protein
MWSPVRVILPQMRTLYGSFAARAAGAPGAVAVVDSLGAVSYAELERRADRVAGALLAAGFRPGQCACLLAPKSAWAVAAMLGILRAGGVYVPLDPGSPPPRLAAAIAASAPRAVLADPGCAAALPPGLDATTIWLTPDGGGLPEPSGRPERVAPGGLAYLLFTSGSTGAPKGVPISHASAVHFLDWAEGYFGLTPNDRISAHSPLHFDLSVWDVFGGLQAGAQVHLVPPQANLVPHRTAAFIRDNELTQWFSVPSVLVSLLHPGVLTPGDLPALRRLIWCGDVLPTAALRELMRRLPHVQFTNLYGPTEATIASSYHRVAEVPAADAGPVPIGRAVDGERLGVFTAAGDPVADGEVGELCLAGPGLSPGYWNDPGRTAAAFVERPPGRGERWYRTGDLARRDTDGVFHFHGRRDRQIKSRGYRIELDDIAAHLARLPGLSASAVVALPVGGIVGQEICAVYVPAAGADGDARRLRSLLARSLPTYMLPTRWEPMTSLPLNPNGKVDHGALTAALRDRTAVR